MPSPDGDVVVPAHLARRLAALATLGEHVLRERDGGLLLERGLASLIDDLRMSASRPAVVTVGVAEGDWIPAAEAASLAGVSWRHAERLASRGILRARKTGRDWLIDRQAAEDYARRRRVA